MLNAKAHREVLRPHRKTELQKLPVAVPCAVPDRKNQRRALLPSEMILAVEADLSSEREDLLPDVSHDSKEEIRSNVRLSVDQNLLRSTRADELGEHKAGAAVRILHESIQLSVGKCPRPALPELGIGGEIRSSVLPERKHGLLPLFNRSSPLIN